MKFLPLVATVFFSTFATSFGLTESDLTPAAIAGKTLTFTIETGAAPLATNGSWTGVFGGTPGNNFTMTRVNGDTVNSTGTWTYNSNFSGLYEYTLKSFIAGQPDGILTIWISGGVGRYEVFLSGLFGNSQTGGFSIGATATVPEIEVPHPAVSEIAVQQPAGSDLVDGTAKRNFGKVKVGKSGAAKFFTIRNDGTAPLMNLAVRKAGGNRNDFVVAAIGKTSLAAGDSTTFKVTFKPTAKGTRRTAIQITSDDADESPFEVNLVAVGAK